LAEPNPRETAYLFEISEDLGRTEVSLDWLAGNTNAELDTATLNRLQDISKLSQKVKELVFEFLDSFISNRQIKNVLH